MVVALSITKKALDDKRHLVAVCGAVDLFTAPVLKAALDEAIAVGRTRVVVDLTQSTFLDSVAVGILITASEELRASDGRLTLVSGHPIISRSLADAGLDPSVVVCPTREQAIQALDGGDGT